MFSQVEGSHQVGNRLFRVSTEEVILMLWFQVCYSHSVLGSEEVLGGD